MTVENSSRSPESIKRPAGVTLLGWGVLIIACLNLVRFIQAVRQWIFLVELPSAHPIYIALSGLVWVGFTLILGWGIFRGAGWAPMLTRLGVVAYFVYYWLDQWLIQQSPDRWTNWLFIVGVMALIGGCIFWYLSKPRIRNYFGVLHDH